MKQREYTWQAWKTALSIRNGSPQSTENSNVVTCWFIDGAEEHSCTLYRGEVPYTLESTYSQSQNDEDLADFDSDSIIFNTSVERRTLDGRLELSVWPTEGSKTNYISPNWCDPTTWYYSAIRVVAEIPTTSNNIVYTLAHDTIIDAYHGKLSYESRLEDLEGNSFRVTVKVNTVTKTEVNPATDTGDFVINYAAGTITFSSALDPEDDVEVTYHYENGSTWVLHPDPGRQLKISKIEVQFSTDIVLTDTVQFIPYGLADYFAPEYVAAGYIPSGTKIPLGDGEIYKTMLDFINDSNGVLDTLPQLGGDPETNWRAMKTSVQVFRWDYTAVTPIDSSKGLEIHIRLVNDIPLGGWLAVATFYCLSI
jgi:hypothetical protein